jgi:cytochrome c553
MKAIYLVCALLLLAGCSEQKKHEQTPVAVEKIEQNVAQTVEKNADVAQEIIEETATVVEEENISDPADTSVLENTEGSIVAIDAAPETPTAVAQAPEISHPDGSALFASKCVSCHGAKAEKSALNKSQIIAGWPKEKIMAALKGYQDGSYGGAMKTLMMGQVKSLSSSDIEALAEHISQQ